MNNLHILTDEQLVKMSQEGSETAEEILIEKYKALVKSKSKVYFIAGADNEDVVQEGMIGMFKAIRSYDANKEAAFKTYAETCINNQILSAIKKANRQKHQPLNESVSLSFESNGDDYDWEGAPEEEIHGTMVNNPEELTLLKEIVQVLNQCDGGLFSDFERKVWSEWMRGYDYNEIAQRLEKTPKSIDNALQRIRKKIMVYMAEW